MDSKDIYEKRKSHAYKWMVIYGMVGIVSLVPLITVISYLQTESNNSILNMKPSSTNCTLGKYLIVIYAHQLILTFCYIIDAYQSNLWMYDNNFILLVKFFLVVERVVQTIIGISCFIYNCIGMYVIISISNNVKKSGILLFVLAIFTMIIEYYFSAQSILCFYVRQKHELIDEIKKSEYEEFDNYV